MADDTSRTIMAVYISGYVTLDPADPAWGKTSETIINFSRRLNEAGARTTFLPDEVRQAKVKALHNGSDIFVSHIQEVIIYSFDFC